MIRENEHRTSEAPNPGSRNVLNPTLESRIYYILAVAFKVPLIQFKAPKKYAVTPFGRLAPFKGISAHYLNPQLKHPNPYILDPNPKS